MNGRGIEYDLSRNKRLLERGQAVVVQCRHFRCMAYRGDDGKWRNYFSDEALEGDVKEIGWSDIAEQS